MIVISAMPGLLNGVFKETGSDESAGGFFSVTCVLGSKSDVVELCFVDEPGPYNKNKNATKITMPIIYKVFLGVPVDVVDDVVGVDGEELLSVELFGILSSKVTLVRS